MGRKRLLKRFERRMLKRELRRAEYERGGEYEPSGVVAFLVALPIVVIVLIVLVGCAQPVVTIP